GVGGNRTPRARAAGEHWTAPQRTVRATRHDQAYFPCRRRSSRCTFAAMRWRCCVAACLLGIAGAATTARALDVTGNWDAMPFDPNIRQTASGDPRLGYLGVCLPGSGPIGSGTLDTGSGTFTIAFDPVRLFQAGYSLACSWTWSGTFAADGTSFTGTFTFDAFVSQPPPQLGYCSGATTTPISGTRLGAPLPCCGDGVVDVGETCDPGGLPGTCCDEGTCAPK